MAEGMDPVFFEMHSGLEHEAPGCRADTLRALRLTGLGGPLRVLDAGSGPGSASLTLLEAFSQAHVTAVDLHGPFLDDARARIDAAGCGSRFETRQADMIDPGFAPGSLDLIWSEGAAYSVGLERALSAWRELLAPRGMIGFSELIWRTGTPHKDARAFWQEGYPAMGDADAVRSKIDVAGLHPVGDFEVSEDGWRSYYEPLAERLSRLVDKYGPEHPVLVAEREEIALWRAHGSDFGYGFFVASRDAPA
jgi:SAM-dependent methyltransferase